MKRSPATATFSTIKASNPSPLASIPVIVPSVSAISICQCNFGFISPPKNENGTWKGRRERTLLIPFSLLLSPFVVLPAAIRSG
jgi:hypothetical protein